MFLHHIFPKDQAHWNLRLAIPGQEGGAIAGILSSIVHAARHILLLEDDAPQGRRVRPCPPQYSRGVLPVNRRSEPARWRGTTAAPALRPPTPPAGRSCGGPERAIWGVEKGGYRRNDSSNDPDRSNTNHPRTQEMAAAGRTGSIGPP